MGYLNIGARRQLRNHLQEIECQVVRLLCEDNSFLSNDEAASIRWSMSMARLTKIRVDKEKVSSDVLIDPALDRYRAELFAVLSSVLNSFGLPDKEKLKSAVLKISRLAKSERKDLLSLFAQKLPRNALDDATRRRPLALTLSGGGGTSYVFVGAFHALEESGLIPNIITGSSMGAILGAWRARSVNFSFDGLNALVEKTLWNKIVQPYNGPSRFGVPATFRLYLRDVVGHEFEKGGDFLRISDLKIPLRVCVAGLSAANAPKEDELNKYAHLLDDIKTGGLKNQTKNRSIISIIIEFAQKPLKAIYLGGDNLTKEFDVLDAIGFSAAIPGIFHYDILRNDPRMVKLVRSLFEKEHIIRLIDGGFVDNLPAREAIRAIAQGVSDSYDPFVISLDGFTPGLNRHILFYPLMRFAVENSRDGHSVSHLSVVFKNVLSPINIVPTHETLRFAMKNGYLEFLPHITFIRKMVGPIPEPCWLKDFPDGKF
jgi:predicted acylesterase/phospholipase RssA